jgi:hypothetical protein
VKHTGAGSNEAVLLDGLESGTYIVSLYDAEGLPLLTTRIIKMK